ncbi:hypothetical protein ACI48D_25675 [Massilia sp. LXY-6]|uniref:hypothetical protein n=1 Tax=Massilia sp. LXY-6 TaxID=3379823 RepID=UPI003EDEF631
MADIAFALTAVTIDEQIVRQRAAGANGRLIRLDDDETHRRWSQALYAEIEAGKVLASVRSTKQIWVLLGCHVRTLKNPDILNNAKDAVGEPVEVLAQLFFMYDLACAAPFGYVQYVGTIHIAVDQNWRVGTKYVNMLDVRLKPIHPGRWLLQMHSISYTTELAFAKQTARCFTVRHGPASDVFQLIATPKHATQAALAYATVSASAHKVPWKSRRAGDQIDKYALLQLVLARIGQSLGLAMLRVNVEPLYRYRQVGSQAQAKKELTHEKVIGQTAEVLANYQFHVTSHMGRPEFLASLMRQMFPFAHWEPVDEVDNWPGTIEHLLAVVNTPFRGESVETDAKVAVRAHRFPVLQCITDTTLNTIVKSIERRVAKTAADAAVGKTETRRPPQEHEVIARALLIQLLLKIELRHSRFLLRRPWMGHVQAEKYIFVFREFGDKRWSVVKPLDDFHFEVQVGEKIHRLLVDSRIPVLIDPPEQGKDKRGKDYEKILLAARRAVIIRNTEINAYSAQRGGHAGIWLIPELFAYISLGADAAASDLSTKVAPRLRVVEAYEYGMPSEETWRWQTLLDMACLAYDPTVRLFKTSAFPIFVKLAAEKLAALSESAYAG